MSSGRDERAEALDRAARALARRDHSAASLRAKLARSGFSQQAREDAVEALAGSGYVDDAKFACDRAVRLAGRGYGDEWIRADLAAQGVPAGDIEAAIAALAPERERALDAAAGHADAVRAARALERRGFSEGALEGVLAHAVADDPRAGVG